jgi:hypothetical protein
MIIMLFSSLRAAILVAAATLLSAGAQAGPMPTNVAAMKSMVDQNTTEVRWVGGYRVGWGYRRLGYGLAAGAIVGGAIASSGYYGGYGGYYGADPYYSYAAVPYGYGGGYGYGGCGCPSYGGYAARYYGW